MSTISQHHELSALLARTIAGADAGTRSDDLIIEDLSRPSLSGYTFTLCGE